MAGPRDCHAEWNKSDREREVLCDMAYIQNLKWNYTNETRLTDLEIESMVTREGRWGGEGIVRE